MGGFRGASFLGIPFDLTKVSVRCVCVSVCVEFVYMCVYVYFVGLLWCVLKRVCLRSVHRF